MYFEYKLAIDVVTLSKMNKKFDPKIASPKEFLTYLQKFYTSRKPNFKKITNAQMSEIIDKVSRSYAEGIEDEKKIQTMISEMKKQLEKEHKHLHKNLPTKSQDVYTYSILKPLVKDVEKTLGEMGYRIPKDIVSGSLYVGQVNAISIKTPSGGLIVAVNVGTFMFIYIFNKIISSYLPHSIKKGGVELSVDKKTLKELVKNNEIGNRRFISILFSYIKLGDAAFIKPFFVEDKRIMFVQLMTNTAEIFSLAHEYAHILLENWENKNKTIKKMLGSDLEIEVIKNWKKELEADNLALQVAIKHNIKNRYDLALSYLGIDVFLSLLKLVYDIKGTSDFITHPSIEKRREFLRKQILKNFEKEESKKVLDLCIFFQSLIAEVWNYNKEEFYKIISNYYSRTY